jgi:hypothetical protein
LRLAARAPLHRGFESPHVYHFSVPLSCCDGATPRIALVVSPDLDSQQVGVNLLIAVLGGPEVEGNKGQFIHDRHGVPIFS